MNYTIQSGTIAITKMALLNCKIGAYGVCYEHYHIGSESGWSFIFENGDYDGFSSDDVNNILHLPGVQCNELLDYEFSNVMRLAKDYRQGVFDPAFQIARNLDPSLVFPAHKGRFR